MKNILFAVLMLFSSVALAGHCGGDHDDHGQDEKTEKTEA